jgi:hypothetical protein
VAAHFLLHSPYLSAHGNSHFPVKSNSYALVREYVRSYYEHCYLPRFSSTSSPSLNFLSLLL